MSLKLNPLKKEMKSGKSKVGSYTPPRYLYRDADNYTKLPLKSDTLSIIPKKLNFKASKKADIDYVGVIKSEYPNRKKPKGNSKGVGPSYKVTIKFENVVFNKTPTKVFTEEVELKGVKYYHEKPTLRAHSAKIRCQCVDFRHKFETPIARAGSLAYGSARGYSRITPKWSEESMKAWRENPWSKNTNPTGNRKPYPHANPSDKLGYCKHIHSFIAYLIDDAEVVRNKR